MCASYVYSSLSIYGVDINLLPIPIMQQGGAFHFTNKLLVLFKLNLFRRSDFSFCYPWLCA